MKKLHKIFTLLLAAVMLLTMSSTALAAGIVATEDLALTGMNNGAISQGVTAYFEARADYLLGNAETMDWSVTGIANDETAHMAQYNANGIVLTDISFAVEDMEFFDTFATVTVLETVSYIKNNIAETEEVSHDLTLYLNEENIPVVAADAYAELFSGFLSCSYVAPSMQTLANTTTPGSSLCIVEIAKKELGTVETGTNMTKYGEWYGWNGKTWCAIFVSWCANQANVSTSIIVKEISPYRMLNFFRDQGNLYYSLSNGGSYTPVAGDILFVGTQTHNPSHVAIVEKVENGTVWVYDGNWSDRVNYHSYALTASDIIGYGHPDYVNSSHDTSSAYCYDSTHHWKVCTVCQAITNKSAHIIITDSYGIRKCKLCDCRAFSSGVLATVPTPEFCCE